MGVPSYIAVHLSLIFVCAVLYVVFLVHCVLRFDWLLTVSISILCVVSPVPNAFSLPHLENSLSWSLFLFYNTGPFVYKRFELQTFKQKRE